MIKIIAPDTYGFLLLWLCYEHKNNDLDIDSFIGFLDLLENNLIKAMLINDTKDFGKMFITIYNHFYRKIRKKKIEETLNMM